MGMYPIMTEMPFVHAKSHNPLTIFVAFKKRTYEFLKWVDQLLSEEAFRDTCGHDASLIR